jgi:hypothetical protein
VLEIQQWWPTPVMTGRIPLQEAMLEDLKKLVQWRELLHRHNPKAHSLPQVPGHNFRSTYNLFAEEQPPEFAPALQEFRGFVRSVYPEYLKQSYGVSGIDDASIEARCFGNVQTRGQRTMPHYHHTCDHVMALYLDCGSNRGEFADQKNRQGDGELLIQDPRHFSSFPFWDKYKTIQTFNGLMVLHPASLWHESNVMTADGERVLIVVTLKMASHNYTDTYCEL